MVSLVLIELIASTSHVGQTRLILLAERTSTLIVLVSLVKPLPKSTTCSPTRKTVFAVLYLWIAKKVSSGTIKTKNVNASK